MGEQMRVTGAPKAPRWEWEVLQGFTPSPPSVFSYLVFRGIKFQNLEYAWNPGLIALKKPEV
jgi:hypothetical protein